MFEKIMKLFKKEKKGGDTPANSKSAAKERLHLVLMQDRANVSADFLDLMKQEIIEVIKKYIEVDESAIDVRLTNKENEDGTNGAPALYANIPIVNIKNEARKIENKIKEDKKEENKEIKTETSANNIDKEENKDETNDKQNKGTKEDGVNKKDKDNKANKNEENVSKENIKNENENITNETTKKISNKNIPNENEGEENNKISKVDKKGKEIKEKQITTENK